MIVCNQSGIFCALKVAIVVGINRMDDAKIGGITPETLSLSGRCEDSPPNMRWPTWRLGYWTKRRRWARSMNTMNPTKAQAKTARAMTTSGPIEPVLAPSKTVPMACGKRATIPAKMISEMPLPTPLLVICSPIHINRIVPPVSVTTAVNAEEHAGLEHDALGMLETDGDAKCLDGRERDGAVARVLVDDLAARPRLPSSALPVPETRSSSTA